MGDGTELQGATWKGRGDGVFDCLTPFNILRVWAGCVIGPGKQKGGLGIGYVYYLDWILGLWY